MSDLARLLFSVPNEAADAVANLLHEQVGAGIEQRDGDTLEPPTNPALTDLLVWVPSSDVQSHVDNVERLLASLEQMGTPTEGWTWKSEQTDPAEWVDAYKKYFKVTRIARHTVIKPSWEAYEGTPYEIVIEMDPGQAFGTGLHASTRLVISALERSARLGPTPAAILDVGCGTGILAMVAAKLWPASSVYAIDDDPLAVQIARENVERNRLKTQVRVECEPAASLKGVYGMVCANLTSEKLTELQPTLRDCVGGFGRIALSGLLAEQAAEVCRVYTRDLALESEYSEEQNGWRCLVLKARA